MDEKVLPNVPEPIFVPLGEEDIPRQIGEEFFGHILFYLGYGDKTASHFSKCSEGTFIVYGPGIPLHTNHRITMLIVRGIPVASIIYWREKPKRTCVIYSHNLSNEHIINRVRCPGDKVLAFSGWH